MVTIQRSLSAAKNPVTMINDHWPIVILSAVMLNDPDPERKIKNLKEFRKTNLNYKKFKDLQLLS